MLGKELAAMELKTIIQDGKKVKLYPAYNTENHSHDIEFRFNRCKNTMYGMEMGDIKWDDETYDKLEELCDRLDEIRNYDGNFYPMTYLPYPLYELAKETIAWADNERHSHCHNYEQYDDEELDLTEQSKGRT